MKTLIVLLVLAVSGLLWLRNENDNLRRSFEKANRVAGEQKITTGMLKNQLSVAIDQAGKNQQAQVELRQKLDAATEQAVQLEQTITRLLNENETFRRWYRTDLPDAVRRVHRRAFCASAGHCLQRMPESQSLPDAGKRTKN